MLQILGTVDIAIIWIGIAIILAIVEAATMGLTTIWFAAGALAGAFTSMFTNSLIIQVVVFIAVSVVLLVFTRPILNKHFTKKTIKTNADALVGMTGVVMEDIEPLRPGQVKVNGQMWTAVAGDETIYKGQEILVKEISSVKLVVTKKVD